MPTYESARYGEWPPGVHWTPGKRRELSLVGDPPPWLKVVKPKAKPKAKPKTEEPETK